MCLRLGSGITSTQEDPAFENRKRRFCRSKSCSFSECTYATEKGLGYSSVRIITRYELCVIVVDVEQNETGTK